MSLSQVQDQQFLLKEANSPNEIQEIRINEDNLQKGIEMYKKQEFQLALNLFDKVPIGFDQFGIINFFSCLIYAKLGDMNKMIYHYDQAISKQPGFIFQMSQYQEGKIIGDHFQFLGDQSYHLGNYILALHYYKIASQLLNHNKSLILKIGDCYTKLQNYNEAIIHYSNAINNHPNCDEYYLQKGIILNICNLNQESFACFDKIINKENSKLKDVAWIEKGKVFSKIREYNKALEAFNEAIQLNPSNDEAYYEQGQVHDLLKNFSSAILSYDYALKTSQIKFHSQQQENQSINNEESKENKEYVQNQQIEESVYFDVENYQQPQTCVCQLI